MKKRRIGIDWDGVLIDWHGFSDFKDAFGEPKEDSVVAVNALVDQGYECYILTAREKKDWGAIRKWLKKHKFPEMKVTNVKVPSVAFIDDRGIRFTNWKDIYKYFR